jgi:outer membrane protein assembly factor BamB
MKKSFLKPNSTLLFILAFFLILTSCTTNEWPQFRGPDCSMVITGKDLPAEWSDSLNIKWTQNMEGESWSSPIVWGDKVFYSTAVLMKKAPEKPKDENNEQKENERLLP